MVEWLVWFDSAGSGQYDERGRFVGMVGRRVSRLLGWRCISAVA
jgi:hypothetical protein